MPNLLLLLCLFLLAGDNPPAEGFQAEASDPAAIELADRVVEAVGGRAAWDETRHLRWRFFGNRLHHWDKLEMRSRIEGKTREGLEFVLLLNLRDKSGRAQLDGVKLDGEELATWLDRAEAMWINDSYWMFLPWKLKDSGVTLRLGEPSNLPDGRSCQQLELTFEEVGRTPENRYVLQIADDTHLIEQWEYYENRDEQKPALVTEWSDWSQYGEIRLAATRREVEDMDYISVFGELPEDVYRSFQSTSSID